MTKPYTPYRRTLAWIGFITLYILAPLAFAFTIYALNATAYEMADRADAFYQQTQANH